MKRDWYNRNLRLDCLSKAGLEALSVGCKVVRPEGVIDVLPEKNRPEVVVKKLYDLYGSLLARK